MGEIVGAGLISHVPTVMLPLETRLGLNEGSDISFIDGFARLRSEVLDTLRPDTIVVFDSHWFTTVEHVVSTHGRRSGKLTSSELPRGVAQVPYDYAGDPELAELIVRHGVELGTPMHGSDDPHLPVFYATINLVHYLHRGERWVSTSIAQTGEDDDFLTVGQAVGAAVSRLEGRRVVLMASGGMSHRFWKLKQIEKHEASDPSHIITPAAREADEQRLAWMREGDHASILDSMDDYHRHLPEAGFGHYLMMVGALGGRECVAPGRMFSDYENATGTGQAHVWFDRPDGGWVSSATSMAPQATEPSRT